MPAIIKKRNHGREALFAAILMALAGCAEKGPGVSHPADIDPVVGDWQGLATYENARPETLAVQVIGYEDGKFQANIGRKFDTRAPYLVVMTGTADSTGIIFTGSQNDTSWSGRIAGEQFSGRISGKSAGSFSLRKIIRNPETLGLLPPAEATVLFSGGSLANWEHIPDPAGYINLSRFFGGDDRVAYLRTRIYSDAAGTAKIAAGGDDGIKIWLNGEPVLGSNEGRTAEPGRDRADINLQQGWNPILVKVNNGSGGWGAYLQVTDRDGKPPAGVKVEDPANPGQPDPDFPQKTGNFIMRWEAAGPYMIDGMAGRDLFDQIFAPEHGSAGDVAWRIIDPGSVDYSPRWLLEADRMQVRPGSGNLISTARFKDAYYHIEFRTPYMPGARGQKRGNSGVYIQGRYEIQVLDSYGLEGKDNECGGIYKVSAPRVNMCAPPMQWQTYDIEFTAPRFDSAGAKTADALITVRHNGILIHDNLGLPGNTGGALDDRLAEPGGLMLQDHGDPVAYRNIWVMPRE